MTASQAHILLVEDSPPQAMGMMNALKRAGFEVHWVTTGNEALTSLAERRADLVITDFHLPDMLGDELCKLMRNRFDTRDIPVILLTIEQARRLQLRALQSGVDDYFEKTVKPSEILPRVHSLLRKGRAPSARLSQQQLRPRLLLAVASRERMESLAGSFEELGFEVFAARSLAEAAQRRDEVDGILLEASLVAEDQSPAWQAVLDRETAAMAPPLMILSASESSNAFLLEAGADDVINIDAEPEVLRLKVKNQVLRHRARKENLDLEGRYREQELRAAMASELEEKNRALSLSYQQLKNTQSQLVHSERMAALGQMVAGMAHEINNPLAYVTGNVHNVLAWIAGLEPVVETILENKQRDRWEKIKARLRESLDGLERVKDLVLQLRTYSRLDEAQLKAIDVEDSARSVLRILGHRIREQQVNLREEYQATTLLECHSGAFNQVVMNLMTNALDAVPQGGEVLLRTWEDGESFLLSVSDNGPGIPSEIQDMMFEPFFTTKPAGKGTGLGLAISRRIVEEHGGVLSTGTAPPGMTTTFTVSIPHKKEAPRES